MPGFKLNLFSGLRPRIPESLLPQGAATIAQNCDFAYGELRNTKGGFAYLSLSNAPGSLYTDDGLTFFSWTGDVNAVRSPLARDTFERMYYTGDGGFKVARRLDTRITGGPPASSYLVGVPRPTVAPVLGAAPVGEEEHKETRAYVYTYVNTYGEEGPPSPPASVTTSPVSDVTVTVVRDSITTGYAPIKEIRIYRTPTGSTIADYFYVGAVATLSGPGTFTFTDNVKGEMLNEPLSSTEYYPPDQRLVGLMPLPNGILCAWKGNELHFSEAYKPWAWPPKYVKTLPTNIVGGIAHGTGAVITTAAHPYLVSGFAPDSMVVSKINVEQAGVSKWSIAVADGVVIYASNDGLVALTGATASLVQGQKFFTREVWRQRVGAGLSSMRFAVWDGRLVVYSSTGSFTPFMIRFDEADGTMTDLPEFVAQCTFTSTLSDQMYYAAGNTLYQFNGGTAQNAVWQSGEVVLPYPLNFGVAQALVEGAWSVELWAFVQNPATGAFEYQLKHTEALAGGLKSFRLPSGYESDRYRIKIAGTGRFRELRMARTFGELSAS